MPRTSALVDLLRSPELAPSRTLADWDLIVRQGRQALLLSHVAAILRTGRLLESLPEQVRRHLDSATIITNRQHQALHAEVRALGVALAERGIPVILLKGAAYVLSGLSAGSGRSMSDIDLLFHKDHLQQASTTLFTLGFVAGPMNEYDRRYYREWSHELPPVTHRQRQTTLDLHHHIIPPTCRLKPDIGLLLQSTVPVPGFDNVFTLAPTDLVLHGATHLFHDGDLDHGLRDIIDLHCLLTEFSAQTPQFYELLLDRARQLDLTLPLAYALRYTKMLIQTPVPANVATQTDASLGKRCRLMDILFTRAFAPPHASCDDWATPMARWLLFVRSHYLRMPMHLLLPHLLRKALRRAPKAHQDALEYPPGCHDLTAALARQAQRERRSKQRNA